MPLGQKQYEESVQYPYQADVSQNDVRSQYPLYSMNPLQNSQSLGWKNLREFGLGRILDGLFRVLPLWYIIDYFVIFCRM